jgi:hypothetical protein|mmetsp:Transcript_13134/g.23808  ORF Transcript_13134/g.23808 Transcript_13134/m.23808 type:complete len:285 (-) Transcript_13134:195-1049(-)|eukprot:CAMPEP_0198289946 /NCGR_PEP_ID=MMETSP1449-20131203/7968_1 /TAXON_ID=420275 /ORGANISM="Attheya septentrionalis, Strain CCMP2084" /LENGTH=284 /DNA_ID=CAMNT_0043988353 /DNA_START=120 /DNA_END=974 /DNA_ORIENTATION=+
MSRRYSRAGGTSDAALLAADRVLSKEQEYRNSVKKIQTLAYFLAERIHPENGDLTQTFADDPDFLQEQRENLKNFAEGNAQRLREVNHFIKAVGEVRDEVQAKQQTQEENAGDSSSSPTDYANSIRNKIEKNRVQDEANQVELRLEDYPVEMRSRLGEKEPKKRKQKGRRSIDDDDDDDLEVINTQSGGIDSVQSLKCPFTSSFYEDPVRNKVCGHTYSRAGLMQLINTRGQQPCPVTGCSNNSVTMNQCEDDMEMIMKVHRYKRREEIEKQQRMATMDDEDCL